MSPSTSQSIIENARYHADLLKLQDELSYAPSALSQQSTYLADLQERVKKIKQNVEEFSKVTKKERKEHERLRDSTARRLTAKLTGKKEKFEAKREKEEREYIEALEDEMKERGNLKTIETMLVEGNRVKDDLSQKSLRLTQVENEIQVLYDRIFGGPTQEFPRDDQLESQLESAQQAYNGIQGHLNSQARSVQLLSQADAAMRRCLASMQEALGYSTWDVYGGGTMADMMERSALGEASLAAARARMLVQQARQTCSDVRDVGPIRVYEISMFGDVFFDNIFSDIAVHRKMEANLRELAQGQERIKRELKAAAARCERIGPDLIEASEVLSQCRRDLVQYRRQTFERISRGEDSQSPPAYQDQGAPPPPFPQSTVEPARSSSPLSGFSQPTTPSYPPPPGPPPTSNPAPQAPPPQHASTQYQSPAGPPPTEPSQAVLTEDNQTTPSSVPMRWGSKNPFASVVMGGDGHGSSQSQYSMPAVSGSSGDARDQPQGSSSVFAETGSSSSAPNHWVSKNPFAFSLMGEHARGGQEQERKKVAE
ncbi:hypothetical protein E1B28_013683 [Marasmius oreades]|uniref:Uncharacterized protein n=1 Tax=Marasmius oreades TaxID=181124 RepID=A0A9P7UN99_9AGAR|nr:uncharacterized protein E1B28_013683 [Marasmius oreades]KAG7087740.1 hypothetical protein E1B28_013683 [Marasmius oreades]